MKRQDIFVYRWVLIIPICQIFEFISRAECQSLRVALPRETGEKRSGGGVKTIDHSGLCDRKDWQYAPKENKKMT